MDRRELSGAFTDDGKWAELQKELSSCECSISTLRIYHNTPAQLAATAGALTHNSSVTHFDAGAVEGPAAESALHQLLKVSISIQTLVIQKLQHSTDTTSSIAPSTAPAHPSPAQAAGQQATAVTSAPEPVPAQSQVSTTGLFQGLAINSSIQHLALHNLQPAQILQLAAALSAGGCAGALQQLNLQGARLDATAAAALSAALCSQPQLTHLGLKGAAFLCQQQSLPGLQPEQPHEQQNSQQLSQRKLQGQHDQRQHDQLQEPQCADHDMQEAEGGLVADCAAAQLFTAALAAHPSLTHVTLHTATFSSSNRGSAGAAASSSSSSSSNGEGCCRSLGVYVAAARHLQELVLSESGLGDSDMQQLGHGLETAAAASATAAAPVLIEHGSGTSSGSGSSPAQSGTRVLDLRGNSIGPAGAMQLGRGLRRGCVSLRVLQLGSNQLGSDGVSRFVEGLLAVNTATVDAHGPGEYAAAPAAAAGGCMRLQELDLSGNNIADAAGLQQLLTHPLGRGLLSLNLSHNCLDDTAAQHITAALINSNHPSPTAAAAAAAAAGPGGCQLTRLDLSHNWIKDEGGKALAALLQRSTTSSSAPSSPSSSSSGHDPCSSLSALLLNHNRMSRAAVELLADAAVGNRRVLELQLQGNRALGRLQALEDLKLVLADRKHKLQCQQQQQEEKQQQQQQQQQQMGGAGDLLPDVVMAAGDAAAASTDGGSCDSSSANMAAVAADGLGGDAAATARADPASRSSSSRSRSPTVAGVKRRSEEGTGSDAGVSPAADGAAAAACDSTAPEAVAACVEDPLAHPGVASTSTAIPPAPTAATAAAAAAVGGEDAMPLDAPALIPVGSAATCPAAAGSMPAAVPNYLQKAAAAAAAATAAAAAGSTFLSSGAAAGAFSLGDGTAPSAAAALPMLSDGCIPASSSSSSGMLTKPRPSLFSSASEPVRGPLNDLPMSFQLPSLAGRFLQQQQRQRLGLGIGERSFSFDQWCEDNALQLDCWGSSLGGGRGSRMAAGSTGSTAIGSFSARSAAGSASTANAAGSTGGTASGSACGKVRQVGAAAAATLLDADGEEGAVAADSAASLSGAGAGDLGNLAPAAGRGSEAGQAALLLGDTEETESAAEACAESNDSDMTVMPTLEGLAGAGAAAAAAGRPPALAGQAARSSSSNGHLLGEAFGVVGGGEACGVVGAQGAGDVGGLLGRSSKYRDERPAGLRTLGAQAQGVGRVSSLSGWMDDDGFVQAGQELLLPGVRRKYVFVHGRCNSSGSGDGSTLSSAAAAVGKSLGFALRPFGSADLVAASAFTQAEGGLQAWRGSDGTSSNSAQPAAAGTVGDSRPQPPRGNGSTNGSAGSSRRSRLLLCSAVREASGAGGRVLRLQPRASAASLQLFGSSDGGGSGSNSRSSSRSSSIGGDGGSDDGGRQGGVKGVLVLKRGGGGGDGGRADVRSRLGAISSSR